MKFEASQNRQTSQQRQLLCPHPFARRYRTGAVPRPVSLKAAISAQTNAPERAESISGHPAPGTLRLGRTEPCHRLRIRPYPPQGQSPTLPHRSDASGASVGTTSPTAAGKTPVLCNFQSVRLFRRTRTHSTARFASALPAAKGRTNTPFPFVLESPIYKSFRRKKPAPALHTAIYHTRRKRHLTAAVRLGENGRHSPACLLAFYALTHSARGRGLAWRGLQTQSGLTGV